MTRELKLTILLIKEGPLWVAQCLEHDIAAQGGTIDETMDAFGVVLTAQLVMDYEAGREPLAELQPAPRAYWEQLEDAKALQEAPTLPLPDFVPPAWICPVQPELRVR
ncbi:MAG: hypothetical protein K8H88_14195 [Sandaracinaceae bacterium]|nr:hypothetical protein [Sandaracinaceae bacterium]